MAEMIRDRTTAGMQAAKRRGVKLGRPVKLDADKLAQARKMLKAGISRKAVAETLEVSPLTLRRALAESKGVKLIR